ncbi:MAG: histidine triad nucleotide-binding protein [Candidatus Gastranaerophilales bacterium]|nr:histidine triad nucleotide-binding protein [Candidatus Gastranaerophilales bacterium]
MYKEDCIFCKIAQGQIPSTKVFENDEILAFRDINPKAPTHILIIPKAHYETLSDVDNETLLGKLLQAVQQITKGLEIEHYRTVINNGSGAGQEVFHMHLHILAGRKLDWPPG